MKMQWSHKGRPLYISISRNEPGDTSLDGHEGTWHVARP